MPGARLSEPDRQQIQAGLAEGWTYSDIARALDRPVSTVTREIARNGGPTAYRAAHAHQASQRRVQRGSLRSTDAEPSADTAAYGRDPIAVRAFEDQLATMFLATGIPRMISRVLACLHTSDTGSVTVAELTQRLRVSPASISKSVAYLEDQGLIRRERQEHSRADRYLIDDEVWYHAMIANARTTKQLADSAGQGAETLGADTPAGIRLGNMQDLLDRIGADLLQAAEDWRMTHG